MTGPGIDPAEAQARQQQLEEELRAADAARQQLLDAQQQTSTQ